MGKTPILQDIIVEASQCEKWDNYSIDELKQFIDYVWGSNSIEYYIEHKIKYFHNAMDYLMWLYESEPPQLIIKYIIEIEENESLLTNHMKFNTKLLNNGIIVVGQQ